MQEVLPKWQGFGTPNPKADSRDWMNRDALARQSNHCRKLIDAYGRANGGLLPRPDSVPMPMPDDLESAAGFVTTRAPRQENLEVECRFYYDQLDMSE